MRRAENGELWKGIRRFVSETNFVQQIEDYVRANGPVSAGELQKIGGETRGGAGQIQDCSGVVIFGSDRYQLAIHKFHPLLRSI